MNLDRDLGSTDEYFVTALQIFDCCGGESTGTLRVDALMDKFAPFIKTNKAEYSYLKSLLDPEQSNPEINVTKLATALHKYSESQKTKVDLDESFNLRNGQMPQDSDSGISTDGFQLLEELQGELREKARLAQQLRGQLDSTDRQHEEALAAIAAERDSLRAHLHMLREENMTLTHVRRDYEEACDRLCGNEQALDVTRRELDCSRKRARLLQDQVATLEGDKLTLQELLNKSKDECHRINEMYASRQSALLEENETLRAGRADLGARLMDREEAMQQLLREKVLLELELKDVLNNSNQTHLRDRSIDVSYTEEQMLCALDSLHADSRFAPDNQLLDEEAFLSALKEDQGRATNLSLFDEIRHSICNISKHDISSDMNETCDKCMGSLTTIGTQTDEGFNDELSSYNDVICTDCSNDVKFIIDQSRFIKPLILISFGTQTDIVTTNNDQIAKQATLVTNVGTQTNAYQLRMLSKAVNTHVNITSQCNNNLEPCQKCLGCDKIKKYTEKLECDLKQSHCAVTELQLDLDKYEHNLTILQSFLDEGNQTNNVLQAVVRSVEAKIGKLEAACADQKKRIDVLECDTRCAECQTQSEYASISTQVDVPCGDCVKRNAVVPPRRLRRYLWEPLKCLFQVFAVVCFVCAVSVLYGVTRRWNARCERDTATVPWRWFDAQDMLDLLLRIEYVADVPM